MADATEHRASAGRGRRMLELVAPPLILIGLIAVSAVIARDRLPTPDELGFAPHAPDWSVLARASTAIKIHLASALAALLLGVVQLAGVKGDRNHRLLGWTWCALILTAAVSSLFIRQINGGALSFIHIITGWTLVALPMGIYAARRGRVAAHRKHMTGLFLGAIIIAGALSFLPGRLMWELLLG